MNRNYTDNNKLNLRISPHFQRPLKQTVIVTITICGLIGLNKRKYKPLECTIFSCCNISQNEFIDIDLIQNGYIDINSQYLINGQPPQKLSQMFNDDSIMQSFHKETVRFKIQNKHTKIKPCKLFIKSDY